MAMSCALFSQKHPHHRCLIDPKYSPEACHPNETEKKHISLI